MCPSFQISLLALTQTGQEVPLAPESSHTFRNDSFSSFLLLLVRHLLLLAMHLLLVAKGICSFETCFNLSICRSISLFLMTISRRVIVFLDLFAKQMLVPENFLQ